MSMVLHSSFILMAAGMGTVFAALAVFYIVIVFSQKVYKPKEE